MKEVILNEVASGKLSPKKAYKLLYKPQTRLRRAYFIKINIDIYQHPWLTAFLKTLFFVPTPLWLGQALLKMSLKNNEALSKAVTKELICSLKVKPINVSVDNNELKFIIKTV